MGDQVLGKEITLILLLLFFLLERASTPYSDRHGFRMVIEYELAIIRNGIQAFQILAGTCELCKTELKKGENCKINFGANSILIGKEAIKQVCSPAHLGHKSTEHPGFNS